MEHMVHERSCQSQSRTTKEVKSLIVQFCMALCLAFDPVSTQAQDPIRPFLKSYCADCHEGTEAERESDLVSLALPNSDTESLRKWSMVYQRVAEHQMPPADVDQPEEADRQRFLDEISKRLTVVESEVRQTNGRSGVRRLSRVEFEASLQDLLHLPHIELASILPSDGLEHGLTKSSKALETSHVQMAKILEATDKALQATIAPTRLKPTIEIRRVTCRELNLMKVQFQQTKAVAMVGNQRDKTFMISDGNFEKRQAGWVCDPPPHFDGALTLMYRAERINGLAPSHSGYYRLRARAFGMNWDRGELLPGKRNEALSLYAENRLVATFDMPPNEPATREAIIWLNAGERFEYAAASLAHKDLNIGSPFYKYDLLTGPALVLQWFEIEGPLHDHWPPTSHTALFGDLPLVALATKPKLGKAVKFNSQDELLASFQQSVVEQDSRRKPLTRKPKRSDKEDVPPVPFPEYELNQREFPKDSLLPEMVRDYTIRPAHPQQEARRLLEQFMERAYGRSIDPEHFELPMAAFQRQHQGTGDFIEAMLAAYRAVLTSPDFLLINPPPRSIERSEWSGDSELDNSELARRLSLFLWNSIPDDVLRKVATESKILDSDTLRQQTERMLNDPRSDRFTDHLCDYWLSLKDAQLTEPDEDLYPEYNQLTLESMLAETRGYVAEMVRCDLPVSYVVDSDFLMLNTRLAELYRLPSPDSFAVRRVALVDKQHRGGLLTQAAILKVTANGTTTSPVTRGAWVLEHLLGITPPPPPPKVPAIEPDLTGATTVRQQLQAHRADASCAGCHRLIDPPGFALESFDVMGGWREKYRSTQSGEPVSGSKDNKPFQYKLGLPVESFGELLDGRKFSGVDEFRTLLLENEKQLAENLLRKLFVIATGATVSFADESEYQQILERLHPAGYPMRAMIHEIVQSRIFQER
jgi:hypothetical protein